MNACEPCLRRRWLIERIAGRIERQRASVMDLLGREDWELIALLGGRDQARLSAEYGRLGPAQLRHLHDQEVAVGLELICPHASDYPQRLCQPVTSPMVLSVNGGTQRLARLVAADGVAIVGTRRATQYGLAAATEMARDLSAAGLTVISGMAFGIDSAAHEGALQAGGRTIAVLAGAAHRPYPARKSGLFRRILDAGVVLSELGAEVGVWRWALQARNRLIAGLAAATVLIEAPQASGALITVSCAAKLERWIGVLPGPVGVPQSVGSNLLLAKHRAGSDVVASDRVRAVRDAQDVLDLIYGEGIVDAPARRPKPALSAPEAALLAKIDNGLGNVTMITPSEFGYLSALELKGWVKRGAGGALVAVQH